VDTGYYERIGVQDGTCVYFDRNALSASVPSKHKTSLKRNYAQSLEARLTNSKEWRILRRDIPRNGLPNGSKSTARK